VTSTLKTVSLQKSDDASNQLRTKSLLHPEHSAPELLGGYGYVERNAALRPLQHIFTVEELIERDKGAFQPLEQIRAE